MLFVDCCLLFRFVGDWLCSVLLFIALLFLFVALVVRCSSLLYIVCCFLFVVRCLMLAVCAVVRCSLCAVDS